MNSHSGNGKGRPGCNWKNYGQLSCNNVECTKGYHPRSWDASNYIP
uniref:Uncharacterized protein n=1 Tax=Picea glauca TaxID=3330 RepID=A0A101M4J5_PICGL|nr:hypothetical protein ABT39_MTgene721 [Picea glauca]